MSVVLGIETSCDETSVAVVNSSREILCNIVLSQLKDHKPFGGVVPEIAARAHLQHLDSIVRRALDETGLGFSDIDAIAATAGPGLIGGVMVGLVTAKALALSSGLPLIAVNHLEGHALTARLSDNVQYPYLLALVSGGHSQFIAVHGLGDYRLLGGTIDDAAGEAFDKCAKMIGLGYPGGPLLEKLANEWPSDQPLPEQVKLPTPMTGKPGCDTSFSGLKTAFRYKLEELIEAYGEKAEGDEKPSLPAPWPAALARSFHEAMIAIFKDRTARALDMMPEAKSLVIAGGVAANQYLRRTIVQIAEGRGIDAVTPPLRLCGDNAAMIAWAGLERFEAGQRDSLDHAARPRWPLSELETPSKLVA